MKKLINIDLVPNFENDDYEIITNIEKNLDNLEWEKYKESVFKILNFYFPYGEILFFNSARSALSFILKIYSEINQLNSNSNVLTQAFTCLVVPNAIKFAGFLPIYVDIDETFNINVEDLKRKINKNTKAIIIQNTFGIPAKIEKILEIAKENNLLVIENLTHSFGAKYKGKYLGNFGDVALLSFNRNKVISSIIGGALVINNEILKEKVLEEYKKLPEFSKEQINKIIFTGKTLYQLKKNYQFLLKGYVYFLRKFGFIKEMISDLEKNGLMPQSYLAKFPNVLFPLLENQLKKLEKFNEHRKKIANIYLEANLFDLNLTDSEPIFLRFPVFSENREKILDNFKRENIYLGDWYTSVLAPKCNLMLFNYQFDCHQAEEISKKILNLPTHIDVSEADAYKIIELFKKWK